MFQSAGPEALLSDKVRGHDTRSVSTSWALFNGVFCSDIQKTAYGSNPNSFISCCLKDVFLSEATFARSVLRVSS